MTRALDEALKQAADISVMAYANLLLNGFHHVSQENGGAARAGNAAGAYITDQNVLQVSTNIAATGQPVSTPFPSQPDILFGMKITVTTASVAVPADHYLLAYQPMEGANLGRLNYGASAARPVTIAFMARSSVATVGYFGLRTLKADLTIGRSFLSRFVLAANTDTLVVLTIPGDVAQALVTTNAEGLRAHWSFAAGVNQQGVPGSWLPTNAHAGADVGNLAAAVGNNVIISGAVLIPGTFKISQDMLPLLARRYDDELRLCQRYWKMGGFYILGAANAPGAVASTTIQWQPMRVAPSLLAYAIGESTNFTNFAQSVGTTEARLWGSAAAASSYQAYGGSYSLNARM